MRLEIMSKTNILKDQSNYELSILILLSCKMNENMLFNYVTAFINSTRSLLSARLDDRIIYKKVLYFMMI